MSHTVFFSTSKQQKAAAEYALESNPTAILSILYHKYKLFTHGRAADVNFRTWLRIQHNSASWAQMIEANSTEDNIADLCFINAYLNATDDRQIW